MPFFSSCTFRVQLADQFCNAIGVLQQCAPPASFSNIQTAINKDQPANPTEGDVRFQPLLVLPASNSDSPMRGLHQSSKSLLAHCTPFRFPCDRIVRFSMCFDADFSFHAEYAQLFATLIARTAKDVDVLIDSLPSEESTSALQVIRGGDARNH